MPKAIATVLRRAPVHRSKVLYLIGLWAQRRVFSPDVIAACSPVDASRPPAIAVPPSPSAARTQLPAPSPLMRKTASIDSESVRDSGVCL